jgi:hypothetical protein
MEKHGIAWPWIVKGALSMMPSLGITQQLEMAEKVEMLVSP